jgi:hypothetical protein
MRTLGLVLAIIGLLVVALSIYMWVAGLPNAVGGVGGGILLMAAGFFCLTRKTKSAAP